VRSAAPRGKAATPAGLPFPSLVPLAVRPSRGGSAIDTIVGHLREALAALGGSRPLLVALPDAEVFEGLSRRMDSGHSVVLREVLDTGCLPGSEGHPDLLSALSLRYDALQNEISDKIEALDRDVPERWGEAVLGQRLQEAGWYALDPWSTTGKGSRKELRSVYQLCYRELLAECERILVQCQSRCDHLDELASKQWLDRPMDNGPRVGACLAEGLRQGESERLKAWRSSLSRSGEEAFCASLAGSWNKLEAPSRHALHLLAARPWANAREDGFQGFARRLLALSQALAETMAWLSRSRWELHLRALPAPSPSGVQA